jgi:hypothetical protein
LMMTMIVLICFPVVASVHLMRLERTCASSQREEDLFCSSEEAGSEMMAAASAAANAVGVNIDRTGKAEKTDWGLGGQGG